MLALRIGLTGFSTDLLIRGVESIVFRAQGHPALEALKVLNLEESVKIAAHWFFVDGFEDVSSCNSVSAF
jgi:hypothetical protein